MRKSLIASLVVGVASLGAAGSAYAESTSPIFGHASVQATTPLENKSVVGKGSLAAYYAYYGNYYLGYAAQYAGYAQYYNYLGNTSTYQSYYQTAATYALDAYYNYNAAGHN